MSEEQGDWREGLPDDVRSHQEIQNTKSVSDLATRFLETKSLVGASIRPPTDDAAPEDIDRFVDRILENNHVPLMRKPNPDDPESLNSLYESLGRPETPEGYEALEGADPDRFSAMAAKAHELGLSKAQFRNLAQAQLDIEGGAAAAAEEARLQGIGALKAEWGEAFGEKVDRSTRLLEATKAPEALVEAIKADGVSADVLKWLDGLAANLGAEGAPMAKEVGEVSAETVQEMRDRRDDISRRLMNDEKLSIREREQLMEKMVGLSAKIIKAEGRAA